MNEIIEYLEKNKQINMANYLREFDTHFSDIYLRNMGLENFTFSVIKNLKSKLSRDKIIENIIKEAKNIELL